MTDFADRVYQGKDAELYAEVLNSALNLLKDNTIGLCILQNANYKDVVDLKTYEEACAKMRAGEEGFAVEEIYIGYFNKDKGSPSGGRCIMAVAEDGDENRQHARGEVYIANQYIKDLIDAVGKEDATRYLTNILAHELTHANQGTHARHLISDSSSRLDCDGKMKQKGGFYLKKAHDGGWEGSLLIEANSDTVGLIMLMQTDEKSDALTGYYQKDIKKLVNLIERLLPVTKIRTFLELQQCLKMLYKTIFI